MFPEHMTGRVITTVNLFGFGGIAILQWLLGVMIGFFPETSNGTYAPEAYRVIFLFTAGLIFVSNMFLFDAETDSSLKPI